MRTSAFNLAATVALLASAAIQASAPKTYVSPKFQYALKVPPGWNISTGDVPVLFNFKPSEGGPQGLFPDHGAEIYVIPIMAVQVAVGAKTIEEWIRHNLTSRHSAVSIKHLSNFGNDDNSPRDVVDVEADFERDPQDGELQHETNYYFALRGELFHLRLLYWKDDPQAANHRAACQLVLRSVRATRR